MWESLPPIVLFIIYENVDLKTKLSASATCKGWRSALFSPRAIILEKLCLKFLCKPVKKRSSDVEKDMCKLFLKHARCLVLDWCCCQKDAIIDVFSTNEYSKGITSHRLQHLYIHPKGSFLGCKTNNACDIDCTNKAIIQTLVRFICACKNIISIDFGFCPEFSRNTDLLNAVDAMARQGMLKYVNISCYDTTVTVLPPDLSEAMLSLIQENLFKNVREVYIQWDEHFENLISQLSVSSASIKTLGLLVHECSFYKAKISPTDVSKLWKCLRSHKPGIEVKLNLTEIHKGDIRTVLVNETPLTSLCVVYKSEDFAEIVLDNLRNTSHGVTLKQLGFHYIECCTRSNIFLNYARNSNISGLVTHLDCLKSLETLSLSGQYVLDTDLLFLVTQHAATLKELLIHKQELVNESQATWEYYILLSAAKIHGLEKTISTTLERPWKMLTDPPVQRMSRRYLSFEQASVWILQDKGF